ncbi:metal ABC transporter substrate-binding protein [Pontivivens ytuae]|uniref:High-affinity zinc uptake system protein ZnuA n=1 Tax=Pontivivens ytuae TaxID=2789856 RepID=A0A7S9QD51_9RHOB|nr:metal ABC transporter substrate-binding protein [Pontivivens ytuae]QPH54515.1 zinc ABC transporter substrate-binding protein [Pontivivens ytuae]
MVRSMMLAAVLAFAAAAATAQDTPRIVAVNYPLQYMAERLLGDEAEVVFPVPEGVDPSFWRPTVADISAVQSADLILLNGAGFATWTARVSLPRSKLVDTSRDVEDRLIATETITHSHGDGGEHSHEGIASYTWLDPMMALAQAEAIAEALTSRVIGDAAEIDARLEALSSNLEAMDEMARGALEGVADTVFVATHPRYQYLARAYGLTILSLEWEAGAMPSDAEMAGLRMLVAENDASVLIWEAEPPAEARAAIAELGLQDVVFPTLAAPVADTAFSDAFGAAVEQMADAAARAESG